MSIDTKERYGLITRVFHWGMAVLIVWQFLKFFDRINDGEHWVGETLVQWHGSIGIVLLLLVVLRMVWAWLQSNNRPEHHPAVAVLAKIAHRVLYLTIFLLPITAICFVLGRGFSVKAFGVELIAGSGSDTPWMQAVGTLHSPLAWLLLLLVIGHITMALLHHFVKKDGTLQRML